QLSGEGEAQLTASATDAIWNCVPVGSKDQKNVVITNNGNSELSVKTIGLLQNNGTFSIVNLPTLPVNLKKDETINLTVEFAPKTNTNGLWDSVLVTAVSAIDANIKAPDFGARVQGNGCIGAPEYSKNCIDSVRIGSKSAPKTNALVIKNMGQGPLKVLSIKPIPPIEFEAFSPAGPFDIDLNKSQDISAIFIPQKKGLRSGFVEIVTDARNVPDTVELCGTGFLPDTVINLGLFNACENPILTLPYPNVSSYEITTNNAASGDINQFSISPLGSFKIPANTNHTYLIAFTPNAAGKYTVNAQLGERNVTVNAEAVTLPVTITSSINPGEVTPGQKVAYKVNADIQGNVGSAQINSLDILVNYDARDLDFTGTIRSLNGWTWTPSVNGNVLTVSGSGTPVLSGKKDLFEADFNAYLGDSTSFKVYVEAKAKDVFAKCLVIDNDTSTLKLAPICFANGRFIRGSGLGYALMVSGQSPASDIATIDYSVGISSHTNIELYNSMGQKVHTLLSGHVKEGAYQLSIDAQQLPAGMYTCIMKSGPFADQVQLIIAK
ncbi:MAG: T9SS type A sorting domain-containing protein, partial [Ignavibacteria bacterium]